MIKTFLIVFFMVISISNAFPRVNDKLSNNTGFVSSLIFAQSTILDQNQSENLVNFLNLTSSRKWNLIYQATTDGFGVSNFLTQAAKSKFIQQGALVLIKVDGPTVFGVYIKNATSKTAYTPNLSIFCSVNIANMPVKIDAVVPNMEYLYSYLYSIASGNISINDLISGLNLKELMNNPLISGILTGLSQLKIYNVEVYA